MTDMLDELDELIVRREIYMNKIDWFYRQKDDMNQDIRLERMDEFRKIVMDTEKEIEEIKEKIRSFLVVK